MKISGLQSISSSVAGILTPALTAVVISILDIYYVFVIDIVTFLIAVFSLLCFVHKFNIYD